MLTMNKEIIIQHLKEFRGSMTQKEYAEMLNIPLRTVQNWESRGCNQTTHNLLLQIYLADKKIKELEEYLKKNQISFQLPK